MGPVGQRGGGGGRHRGQSDVLRTRRSRRCWAWGSRRWCRTPRAEGPRSRVSHFNQAQVLSVLVRADVLRVRLSGDRVCRALASDAATGGARGRVPAVVHSGAGAPVRDGGDGRGAARHRQLQARDDRPDGLRDLNMVLSPFLIFGLGHGPAVGRCGSRDRHVRRTWCGSAWLTFYFLAAELLPEFCAVALEARSGLWRYDAEDRPPGGGGVRAAGGASVCRVRGEPPVWIRGAGRIRHRHAHRPGRLPAVVALGFAVAPVAGQNVGARQGSRRATFRSAVLDGSRRDGNALDRLLDRRRRDGRGFLERPRGVAVGTDT